MSPPPNSPSKFPLHVSLSSLLLTTLILLLTNCQTPATIAKIPSTTTPTTQPPPIPPAPPTFTPFPTIENAITPLPISTPTNPPPIQPTPNPTTQPTLTPIPSCANRLPNQNDFLTFISRQYSISRHYQPRDLVTLNNYLPPSVTNGYTSDLRAVAAVNLTRMVDAMLALGLQPTIISGYRSYAQQQTAWNKWISREPERGALLSAEPGHSEHQLGTTIDFGSPELPDIVGDPDIEFHTYFYRTSEGQWLLAHAHEYGFTLSYPREAFDVTQFYYEPWHYRYIGTEMATHLKNEAISLTEWQLVNNPEPCIP